MRTDKKNFSTRLMTALMAGTLAVGMLGMNVSATETNYITGTGGNIEIPLVKKVLTDKNTYAPATEFGFTIGTNGVTDAPAGTECPEDGISIAPIDFTGEGLGVDGVISKEGKVIVHQDKFTKVGIYKYIVTETVPESKYEGINYNVGNRSYEVNVTVVTENGKTFPKYVEIKQSGQSGKANRIEFENDYGQKEDTTHDVTIEKVITGNQAITSDTFQLVVMVTGTTNEKYKVTLDNVEQEPLVSGKKATYTVTNNTKIHIYGLTKSDKVQAVEEKNNQGYKATYTAGLSEGTLTISEDNSKATVTNTKNAVSPTGIVLNYGPYILMIALAGSMAVFFLRKKNRKEV